MLWDLSICKQMLDHKDLGDLLVCQGLKDSRVYRATEEFPGNLDLQAHQVPVVSQGNPVHQDPTDHQAEMDHPDLAVLRETRDLLDHPACQEFQERKAIEVSAECPVQEESKACTVKRVQTAQEDHLALQVAKDHEVFKVTAGKMAHLDLRAYVELTVFPANQGHRVMLVTWVPQDIQVFQA